MARPKLVVRNVLLRSDRSFLLGRREGGWELPGGKVDEGEPLRLAALREQLEETNIELLGPHELVGYADVKNGVELFLLWRDWNAGPAVLVPPHSAWDWFSANTCPRGELRYGTDRLVNTLLPAYLARESR